MLNTLKQASSLKPIQCLMVSLAVADLLALLPYGVITMTIASGKIVMTPMLCIPYRDYYDLRLLVQQFGYIVQCVR